MSESNPIKVYVTHAFQQSDDYLRVFEFLESMENFFYINCSKPENLPRGGDLKELQDEFIQQIRACEAVLVLASQYIDESDLTHFQMDVAEANDKPMIAIRTYGGIAETPPELIDRVNEHIEWTARGIVDSLARQARLTETTRWETIEFTLD